MHFMFRLFFSEMMNQAKLLVSRISELALLRNSWKLVTFFIGGNDLCGTCMDEVCLKSTFLMRGFNLN